MEIIELIKEPIFWIMSAICSVILSVFANLVTPWAGTLLSKFSQKRKEKIEVKRVALIEEVRFVSSDQNRILNYKVDAAYWLLRAIFLLALGTIVFSLSGFFGNLQIVLFVVAAIFIAKTSQWVDLAIAKYQVARLATERAEAIKKFESQYYHDEYIPSDNHPDPFHDELHNILKEWDKTNI